MIQVSKRVLRVLELSTRRKWGVIWRGALCWALGGLFLITDEGSGFDTRFQLRGEKPPHQEIVLVNMRPAEMSTGKRNQRFSPDTSELMDVTDSFYWDQKVWANLLRKILKQNPKKVGVTLFFNENLGLPHMSPAELAVFQDPRIVWGALANVADRPSLPLFSTYDRRNVGSLDLVRDQDGLIRLFSPVHNEIPHFIERLTGQVFTGPLQINYKGGISAFPQYSMTDLLEEILPENTLEGKYVIVGSESLSATQYLTPFGSQNRASVMGQLLDNALTKSWIKKAPYVLYLALFILLEILCIFLITQYPHSIAFVFLAWIATLIAALSAWVFDTFSIWIPVMSPVLLLLTTWVIFIGYQANKIEQRNYELKQEQKALQELEQLKNNFVSLISHDLKTPIAKISGVVDRMLSTSQEPETRADLKKLHDYSEELNRYIQSILKVLRVESRDFRLNLEVGDINETIVKVIDQVRPLSQQKNLALETELEPLFSIEADFTLIREVILNLVENAIKYTPPGGRILIKSAEIDNAVIVEVHDNGPGIAPEELSQIWGKFTRGKDQELKTKGSGLGLYLVKYFVELHGGDVGIESELGRGSKVRFRLPLEVSGPLAEQELA